METKLNENLWAIGIDVGGTKIEAARVDNKGNIHDRMLVETDVTHGYIAVKKQVISLVKTLITHYKGTPPVGVGIGVAGQIVKEKGIVKYAPNLNWENIPIKLELQDELQLPVLVLNDVRAVTWGEWLYGAGKRCDHMVCIFIGTGIGGGIVSNGKMLEGTTNTAGEIGHMTVDMNGPICRCGNRGCLEALAGSWAIARDVAEAVQNNPESGSLILKHAGGEIQKIKAKHVIEAYHKSDELAHKLVKRVADALGAGLGGLTNILNPERIIVGGGVPEHLPDLIPMIKKIVHERALKAATESLTIVPAQLHGDSGVIGAASLLIHGMSKQQ